MFAEAFAAIATGFSALAGGPFSPATLRWPGEPTLDSGGSITTPGTPTEAACQAQVDIATEAMRADADFQQNDVRLLILSATAPDESASVEIIGGGHPGVYALQSVSRDPAGVGYECRGRLLRGAGELGAES